MRSLAIFNSGPERVPRGLKCGCRWAANDPDALCAAFDALVGWSVADRIGAIGCPTLVVAAEHDNTPVAASRRTCRGCATPSWSLSSTTDICIYTINERPAAVLEAFRGFHPQSLGISSVTAAELFFGVSGASLSDAMPISSDADLYRRPPVDESPSSTRRDCAPRNA
ncbi:MAG: hypothetical protein HS128_07395 [Ideonella sp.]|nr:hypothetical protein [Ideonella sp.]MCC7459534.1 hypothetical protein [Nitrospira sp.]